MGSHFRTWILGTILTGLYLSSARDTDVRQPPSIIDGPPKYILFKKGDRIRLPCESTGEPETYEWYKDGFLIDLNTNDHISLDPERPGYAIIIEADPAKGDEGFYQCEAENSHGKSLSEMLFLQAATLDLTSGEGKLNYHRNAGQPLIMTCNPRESVPDATFRWVTSPEFIDNPTYVVMSKRVNIDTNGNLYFSYVVPEDEKDPGYIYRCNQKNPYLDLTVGTSYSALTVNGDGEGDDVAPELMFRSGEGSTVIGILREELLLGCFFSGKGEVDISWRKSSGGSLPPSINYKTQLRLNPVVLSDEDTYTCTGTNPKGSANGFIEVKIEAKPEFDVEHLGPTNMNASNRDTVVFYCNAFAIPQATTAWYINGIPFADAGLDSRFVLNEDGTALNISNICKTCDNPSHESDLMNIQCNASNVHGYAWSEGYLNVLERTELTVIPPTSTEIVVGEGEEIILPCEGTTDDSTSLTISWLYNGAPFENEEGVRQVDDVTKSLHVWTETQDVAERVMGRYTCVATNGVSTAEALADLVFPDVGATTASFDMWWIFIVIAVILIILIVLLCTILYFQRNAGGDYFVDEKERAQGNNPEKEIEDDRFHDYVRPPEPVPKPFGLGMGTPVSIRHANVAPVGLGVQNPAYIASLPDLDVDSMDGASLAEYGDIDFMKFNEDGSFIGQYHTISASRQQIHVEEPQLPYESNI